MITRAAGSAAGSGRKNEIGFLIPPIALLGALLAGGNSVAQHWSKVIDVSAGLMTAVSLNGLILLFYLHKRRLS